MKGDARLVVQKSVLVENEHEWLALRDALNYAATSGGAKSVTEMRSLTSLLDAMDEADRSAETQGIDVHVR